MSKAILVLQDGTVFLGCGFGATGTSVAEVVFNTSMTGYQEILTDPSYHQQMVVLTHPHIGNTGVNEEDIESEKKGCSGLIVREYSTKPSSWRMSMSLHQWMKKKGLVGISGIDTRHLTIHLRENGSQAGCLMNGEIDLEKATRMAKSFAGILNQDLTQKVSSKKPEVWKGGTWKIKQGYQTPKPRFKQKIFLYDFGVKKNILRQIVDQGFSVDVVPADTPPNSILQKKPAGIVLSNGPGDPASCHYAIKNTKELLASGVPILGICLGHQLLALAMGAKTYKMKFGHHGANHPVKNSKNRILVTSQNHGFSVEKSSLPSDISVTHTSLFDGSIQGIRHKHFNAIGFQGHPEASPGPNDASEVFDDFIDMITIYFAKQKSCQKEQT